MNDREPEPVPASPVSLHRLPAAVRAALGPARAPRPGDLAPDTVHRGDALVLLPRVTPGSVALAIWSPPYFVGKDYESGMSFADWRRLLDSVIRLHFDVLRPGGFLAVNIADILCFRDPAMPRIQAEASDRRRSPVTREMVLRARAEHPGLRRDRLARLLGCSEQTVDRRLHGNNIRGGKHQEQTRVKIVGGMLEEWALAAGLYPYDRRVWVKDPAWENCRWTGLSYRAVDEFEYLYVFWKPGITPVRRARLTAAEWRAWGSRAVWSFPSVRRNHDHESKFPLELPRRAIRLFTDPGDLVLDCFLGSGTTAVAATLEGRRFLGIELRASSVRLARRNLARARPPRR